MLVSLFSGSVFSAEPLSVAKDLDNDRIEFIEDEVIVKYKGDERPFRVVKVPMGKVREKVKEYSAREDVAYAEPNFIAHAFMTPNDPYYTYQWHLDNSVYGGINMESAWDISQGSGVTVAVIDTGIAYENYSQDWRNRYYRAPDLADTCFTPGYDFVNNDSHPNDDNSHGTHVAGTVAQSTNNSKGVAGVAFKSCLMPVKVLDRNGSGSYADVIDGIYYAVDNGAKVINLSLGGSADSQALKEAVAYTYNKGVIVIAAAGNDGSNIIAYPAAYDEYVIAVGATRYDETLAYYSNFGLSLDLVAPGGDLNVDQNGDGYGDGVLQNTFNPNTRNTRDFGYWFFQGTSMAAPHVAGTAALVIANGNATTPDEIRAALETTAEDLGTTGWDATYGWGLVDAFAVLNWTVVPPVPNNPPVASNQSVITNEDTAVPITLTATDPDGDPLTYSVVTPPANGILTGTAPSVTYTPNPNYNGPDSFTFKANDGKVDSNIAMVSITVNSVNDPPLANNQSVTTTQDIPVSITLIAIDVDGDTLTYSLVTLPTNGILSGIAPILTYTPNPGYTGSDSFTFKANDGLVDSNIATVSITINPAAPTTGLKVISVSARDTYPGRNVDVEAFIENLGNTNIDALITVEILELTGVTDQTRETFGPRDIITVELNPRIPKDTTPGTYTAVVTVSWDNLQDSGSATFLVKSRSSRSRD
ncbi:S8 family serine peptidase [Patescibacteria group bacterium]|nr:S8 family serine peptidase [Patescibacteria group bacterium]